VFSCAVIVGEVMIAAVNKTIKNEATHHSSSKISKTVMDVVAIVSIAVVAIFETGWKW
jgi:hypothetical protein